MRTVRCMMLFLLVVLTVSCAAREVGNAPVVATEEGLVLGVQEKATKGRLFYSYYSIPFAKPPVGELRFKDTVPSSRWEGTLDARLPPPLCLQLPFTTISTGNNTVLGREDCLYLNVFTHQIKEKRPVLVYIHGGAFFAGSSSKYPPYVLMNEDIVLVTIQYRLGILGFLSTEDEIIPGNFGLKDQTEALRWVSRNIHHFGGDQSTITLFGESAGAASVHFQMLTPKAKGLFTRAILQSGSALCPWSLGAAHREVSKHTSKLVNCPTHPGPEMLRCLQQAPGDALVLTLLEYFEWLHLPLLLGPRVDGDYLPDEPDILMKDGSFENIDIISGLTSHEGGLFSLTMYARDHIRQHLVDHFNYVGPIAMDFGSLDYLPLQSAKTIFLYYLGGLHVDQSNADAFIKMFTDRHFAVCHDLTTILHARNSDKHKTFRYELDYRGQHSATEFFNLNFTDHWVTHVDDMFYLFTGDIWKPLTQPRDLALRDIFTKLWTNFAATGNPTPGNSLGFRWEPSSETNLHYLSLSPTPIMKQDNRQQVRDFFASIPTHQNQILQDRYPPDLLTSPPTLEVPSTTTMNPIEPTTPMSPNQDVDPSPNQNNDVKGEVRKPTKLPRDEL